jgi:hypothetical protein
VDGWRMDYQRKVLQNVIIPLAGNVLESLARDWLNFALISSHAIG